MDEGFTAINVAPFDELRERDHVRTGPQAAWRPGVARVEAVRGAIGDSVDLMVDCHGRMETSEGITVGRAMADYDLMWYEEPLKHTFPDQRGRISQAVPMPTASAESIFSVEGFRPFLLERVVDVLMPDVKHCGGLGEIRAIAEAASLCHPLIAPHNPSGPVATAGSAHAVCTIPNFLILEYAWGEVDWRAELIEPREAIRDGDLWVSDAAGLGYRLNPDVIAAHRVPE